MEETSFVTKKTLTETFRRLPIGGEITVKTRDFKFNTAKTAKYNLRREGIEIKLTERGMIDEYKAIRLS